MDITTQADLLKGLSSLRLGKTPVIVHSSLKSFGQVEGGASTVVEALLASFQSVIMPAFTYKTMVFPLTGPQDNAMIYGARQDLNRMAEFFSPDMPVDPLIGKIPDTFRKHAHAMRTAHPILSFAGVNASPFLQAQTMEEPFGPIGMLERAKGWVILLGVDHTVNTSIHYAEKTAGRHTFVRWALTPQGVCECPNFPGCSAGFQSIAPDLEPVTRWVQIGKATVRAVPLKELFKAVSERIKQNPLALLCQQEDCGRCTQMRKLLEN